MGELLLCSREIASIPYYIDTISLNVYSLEELCYYLEQNIDLIEPDFMEEELCFWIKTELKDSLLSESLLKMIQKGASLSQFVGVLVSGCSYCTQEEIASMQETLSEFENKSEMECRKIRADHFLQKKKYTVCIAEYRKLLENTKLQEEGRIFEGNIWHNLGTAYAGLFSFTKAAECYQKAYELNLNPASKQQKEAAEHFLENDFPAESSDMDDALFQAGIGNFKEADCLLKQWKEEYKISCK